jgi:KaiC/GvpD/RAD55 family RecA-like ATPase
MSANGSISFSKYGKTFQEKLAFFILDDRTFSDRMMEVMKIEFLEFKYLQVFVEKIFHYKKKYGSQPSHETMKTIIKSGLEKENEALQVQTRQYFARTLADIGILESSQYIKDESIDFCRKQKLREAMLQSTTLLQKCSFDEISVLINNALKAGADADFGYDYLGDFEKRFLHSGRETISTGWPSLDEITAGGHGRGELGVVIAPTGVGKSMVLVHLGAAALKAGMTVVHYTLELKDTVIASRYDSCITGIHLGELMDNKEDIRAQVKDLDGKLIIREYPTKTATTNTIRAHLEKLKQQEAIVPDMIIVDYGDLLRTLSPRQEKREELESIYEELRAIMQENDCAGWTASQTNRTGLNQEIITMQAISEAFNKCFIADLIFSVSRTSEDKQSNGGRVYIAKNRNGQDGLVYSIFMNTSNVEIKLLEQYTPGDSPSPSLSDKEKQQFMLDKYIKLIKGASA